MELSEFAVALLTRLALPLAVLGSPFLLARHISRRGDLLSLLAMSGVGAMGLNFLFPVLLHLGRVSLTGGNLALAHCMLFAALLAALKLRRVPLLPAKRADASAVGVLVLAYAVLALPITRMVGFDTYKMQDLATNVQIEQAIPWLIHPLSLLGFSPRAYASAHPLMLASVEMLGGLGIDWSFYVMSLVSAGTGIFGAAVLGRRLLGEGRAMVLFAFLYVTAPVFVIYNYWATPRGFLVALMPLFIHSLLAIPGLAGVLGTVFLALMLALSHKMGLVAGVMVPVLFLAALALPSWRGRRAVIVLTVLVVILMFATAPALGAGGLGGLRGWTWAVGSRLGLIGVLVFIGLLGPEDWLVARRTRCLLVGMLGTLWLVPAGGRGDLYGALVCLPFAAFAAARGLIWLRERLPERYARGIWAGSIAIAAGLALAALAFRASTATSTEVYLTAQFLERHDPSGPYRVVASERIRRQVQAYVSGCPRFLVGARGESRAGIAALPKPRRSVHDTVRAWIGHGRRLLFVSGTDVAWYGRNPRIYYVQDGDRGRPPADTELLFRVGEVRLFQPRGQHDAGSPQQPSL